jgi:hypothetical protein
MHRFVTQGRAVSLSLQPSFDPWRRVCAAGSCAIVLFATLAILLPSIARAEQGDPDQAAKVSTDVNMALQTIKPGTYRLDVQNQSGLGSIDSFAWVPGPGWRVTSVLQTSQGKCLVVDAALACAGKIEAPKRCTCLPGGHMSITFRMVGPPAPRSSKKLGTVVVGTVGGYFTAKTITLTNHHIPTELPTPNV